MLLSLLPPSYIVASIGELANKHLSATSFSSTNIILFQDFILPTVFSLNNIGMDFFTGPSPNNYDKIRDRSLSTKEYCSRDSSMSSTKSLVAYHDRMEYNNDIVVDNEMVDSTSTLPYETN